MRVETAAASMRATNGGPTQAPWVLLENPPEDTTFPPHHRSVYERVKEVKSEQLVWPLADRSAENRIPVVNAVTASTFLVKVPPPEDRMEGQLPPWKQTHIRQSG